MSELSLSVRPINWFVVLPVSTLAAGVAIWSQGLAYIEPDDMTDIGLASVLPWNMWAAYGLLAAGFCLSLQARCIETPLPFLQLAALVLVLHATPAIAYETLRYSWAWKHIGIVDFIQRNGGTDPHATYLAAYHNWPGFFLVSAWFSDLFALGPLAVASVARFFPTALNLLFLTLLPLIFRRFTTDARLVWTGTCLFLVGNWIGQDYFSPQGTAYLMYLGVLILVLGPLSETRALPSAWSIPWPGLARFRRWMNKQVPEPVGTRSKQYRLVASASAIALILAIVATHQLTPLLLICALGGLALIGRIGAGYLLIAGVAELLWLLYFADPYVSLAIGGIIADLGSLGAETVAKMVDLETVSEGQRLVAIASRTLTAAIGLAALAGFIRRQRHGYRDGPAVVLALAPAPLLLATSYGGEIVFRLYFYALPFLAYFGAALFFPSAAKARSPASFLLLWPVIVALVIGFVLANNGKDRQYRFTQAEVEAAAWLYEHAVPGSLLVEGARNYPSQFRNYENFVYVPLSEEPPEARAEVIERPEQVLFRWLSGYEHGFVIITRSQRAAVEDLGIMPKGALDAIEQALLASPLFRLAYKSADASVFEIRASAALPPALSVD
jgi:hypothetical protein